MPTQATIAITPGSGQFLDAVSLTIGGNLVVRETMVLADPTNATYLAEVTSAGALKIDGSAVTQPVSIASSVAVTGTFWQTTQPVSLASLPSLAAGSALIGQVEISDGTNVLFTSGHPGYVQGTISIGSGPFAVTQSTSPWIVAGGGTAGTPGTAVLTVQGISGGVAVPVSGTFYPVTQPVSIASGQVASGAFASGSIASGAIASGAIAAGAAAAGAFADGSVYVRSNAASTFPVTATIAASQTIAVTQATATSLNAATVPGLPTTGATTRTNTTTSSSGWTSLVSGSGSTTVRLWRLVISAVAATNIEIGDGTNVFLGPYYLQAGGSCVLDISGEPWCTTGAGAALEVNNSNAVAITVTTWTTQS